MSTQSAPFPDAKQIAPLLKPYIKADTRKAIWNLVNTLVPYVALWVAMYFSLSVSYWITLGLAVVAGFFLIRLFIFFHDCGHNSFFPSTKANKIAGFWLGVLVFTPSEQWWHSHAIHHASSGNLDKRGVGDVMTWTVEEYRQKTKLQQFGYRVFRHPLIMFGLGPIYMFLISHRFALKQYGKKESRSVLYCNLALLGIAVTLSIVMGGFGNYLKIQIPVLWVAGIIGVWLFFIQHQFEGVYWKRDAEWDYVRSALEGASFYKLPGIFQWLTGYIGYHHIHHLNPRVPDYLLKKCYQDNILLQERVVTISLFKGFKSVGLNLYDEQAGKLVRFRDI